MFDLTVLDYVYIGVVLISTIWATIRGGIYETVAILSWIIAGIVARFTSPWLDGLLQKLFNLSSSTIGTLVASYFIVFFIIVVIIGFFNQRLRDRIRQSMMKITDHTLGVIFGIIRGVIIMGIVYWAALWYYSDTTLPKWVANARTRPIMQLTAVKIDDWFVPNKGSKLLKRDMTGTKESIEIYNNLINPTVVDKSKNKQKPTPKKVNSAQPAGQSTKPAEEETGYKSSERAALENQLLQIETTVHAQEEREAKEKQNEQQTPTPTTPATSEQVK